MISIIEERWAGRIVIIAELNAAQLSYASRRGGDRRRKAAGARLHRNPKSQAVDGPNNYDRSEGFIGEFAFAMIAHLPAPLPMPGRSDGGRDFELGDGTTIDVKYTRYKSGQFLPRYDEGLRADIGVLMARCGADHRVAFIGWLTREQWQLDAGKHMRVFDAGIGRQAYYPQSNLRAASELLELIDKIQAGA